MTRKKRRGLGRAMGNRTHGATYGMRDRQCPRCKVLLRSADFTDSGICNWCAWELSRPARLIASRNVPCETASQASAKVPGLQ